MRFARVFLKGPTTIWVDYPCDMSLVNFVLSVKLQGGIMPSPQVPVYVAWGEIRLIVEITGVDPPKEQMIFGIPIHGEKPN